MTLLEGADEAIAQGATTVESSSWVPPAHRHDILRDMAEEQRSGHACRNGTEILVVIERHLGPRSPQPVEVGFRQTSLARFRYPWRRQIP